MPAAYCHTIVTLLLLTAVLASAAAQEPVVVLTPDSANPPYTRPLTDAPDPAFRFAVVSDNAGGPRQGAFAAAVRKLNLLRPQFVMSIGDFIEGYEDTAEALERQWTVFEADLAPLDAPFFFVPGNHDNGRPLWDEVYRRRIGAPYYHFVYRGVLLLCLCTNDGPDKGTGMGEAQLQYIEETLAANSEVRWTMLFLHKPLWNYPEADGWPRIAAALGTRPFTAFAGHTHENLANDLGPRQQLITLGTTGGGNPLRGPAYGEFDQVAWVTMDADRPHIAIVATDGVHAHDFLTPEDAEAGRPFKTDQAVQLEIIHADSPEFSDGITTLHVSNPTHQTLVFDGLFEVDPGMRAEPASPRLIVEPGATQTVSVRFSLDTPTPVCRVQPPILHWTAENEPTALGAPPRRFHGRTVALIDQVFTCAAAGGPIAIDGDLADWGDDGLAFTVTRPGQIFLNPDAWRGPQDASYRFGVLHDDAYVYLAIDVRDNELCFDGWKYWSDFAAFYLAVPQTGDADSPGKLALSSVFAAPNVPESTAREYAVGDPLQGVKSVSVKTSDGYVGEVAVPISALSAGADAKLQGFLMNVGVSDHDPSQAHEGVTILHWRPRPDGEGLPRAFGVFVLE